MNMTAEIINQIPTEGELILRGDDRLVGYAHDTMLQGDPEALARPSDEKECAQILAYCNAHQIPVTVCAGRTGMVGGAVATSGLLLSIEKLNKIYDIDEESLTATAAPGIFLGDFKDQLNSAGYFYPPSPTSRNEAMLGATVATNATGDNTYKYGPTRKYIRELKLLLADGTARTLRRPPNHTVTETKNTAGYYLHGNELDYFIGSEGTLGLITEVTVDLLTKPHPQFGLLAFFPSNESALDCIIEIDKSRRVTPSALEYVDNNALRIMSGADSFPSLPDQAKAALIIHQEYAEESYDALLSAWFDLLNSAAPQMNALLDYAILCTQPADEEKLRVWRHHIPAQVNEQGQRLQQDGGGKIGSDWWVPLSNMRYMMDFMYTRSEAANIPYLAFAHLGNGHPHVNYLTRNPQERQIARQLLHSCCREAVRLGGGVAGEHGLGKLKRDLLAIQYPPDIIAQMVDLKKRYDPQFIMGPGNIFSI